MQEILEKICDIVSNSIKTVFDMLLSKEISAVIEDISIVNKEKIQELAGAGKGICSVSFSKGLDQGIYYIFSVKDGSLIIDLMLGGEGLESDALTEDDYDALSEAFNQIIGSSLVPINENFSTDLSLAESQVEVFSNENKNEIINTSFKDNEYYHTVYKIDIEGFDSKEISQFISVDAVASLDKPAEDDTPGILETPEEGEEHIEEESSYKEQADLPIPGTKGIPNIDMIMDIELPVIIRIGDTEMLLQDVLKLSPGAIIELNKSVDSYVDLVVNDKIIAKGEVIVVDSNFALRIKEIKSKAERIKSLRK